MFGSEKKYLAFILYSLILLSFVGILRMILSLSLSAKLLKSRRIWPDWYMKTK